MDRKPERRAFLRIPLEMEVEVQGEGQVRTSLTARDLSEGGIQLDGAELPLEATLQLTLALPEEPRATEPPPPLVVTGEVAWCQPDVIGVRFANLPPDERARLRAFLKGRARA